MNAFDPWAYAPDTRTYLSSGVPDWLDELSLEAAPPHHRMGTRGLDLANPSECLRVDEHRDTELALRGRLLDEQRPLVFAEVPHALDACAETRQLVDSFLTTHGLLASAADDHPLVAAGRAVQEDLCLMVRRGSGWHLDAAVLCFPSLWSLAEKIGRRIDVVHGPVPHYASDLSERVDRFFDRLAVGRVVARRNLSIKPFPLLCLPFEKSDMLPVGEEAADDGSPYWLRTEYQTLQRLPESGAILFTIKSQLAPLGVLRARPDIAQRLLDQLNSWSTDLHAYKSTGSVLERNVLPWLRSVAASA
jgi:dimethylamine monooxygenase subunit A